MKLSDRHRLWILVSILYLCFVVVGVVVLYPKEGSVSELEVSKEISPIHKDEKNMAENVTGPVNMGLWLISILVPLVAALAGVLVGARLTSRQQREQRKLEFIEKQLKYFYSPLLGIRKEIRMLSELRVRISGSAGAQWRRLCDEAGEGSSVTELQRVTAERSEVFMRVIEYSNRQFTESLLPSYRLMVSIFRDNYYLAEEQTCEYFRPLIEYVDIWDRWLDESLPSEVLEDLDQGEEPLHPLYEDLESTHNDLRNKLAKGQA